MKDKQKKVLKYHNIRKNPTKILNHQQIIQNQEISKSKITSSIQNDQDIKWLQQLVTQFQEYRTNKNANNPIASILLNNMHSKQNFNSQIRKKSEKQNTLQQCKYRKKQTASKYKVQAKVKSFRTKDEKEKIYSFHKSVDKNNKEFVRKDKRHISEKKLPSVSSRTEKTVRKYKGEDRNKMISLFGISSGQLQNQFEQTKKISEPNENKILKKIGKIIKNCKKNTLSQTNFENKIINSQNLQKKTSEISQIINKNELKILDQNNQSPIPIEKNKKIQEQRKLNTCIGLKNILSQNQNENKQASNKLSSPNKQIQIKPEGTQSDRLKTKTHKLKQLNQDNISGFINQSLSQLKFVRSLQASTIIPKKRSVAQDKDRSVVLDKIDSYYKNELNQKQSFKANQWDLMHIFDLLDRKNIGILNFNNCSIQNLSRQIRYILGEIFQQILYAQKQLNFKQFIKQAEKILFQKNYHVRNNSYFELGKMEVQNQCFHKRQQQNKSMRNLIETKNKHVIDESDKENSPSFQFFSNKEILKQNKEIQQLKDEEKKIRFATFQNQESPLKNIHPKKYTKQIYGINVQIGRQKALQLELQNKLQIFDQLQVNKKDEKQPIMFQTNEKSQIQKLENLNKRLDKYLRDQENSKIFGKKHIYQNFNQ